MAEINKLANGTTIRTSEGDIVTVKSYIAGGGQGDVYVVDFRGTDMALKWYKVTALGDNPQAFHDNIKRNVLMRDPPPEEFLWPLAITEWVNGTFGYVMRLRPKGYYEVTAFMLGKARFKNYKVNMDAAMHIVSAFRILHNKGLSYQDMNDGNFFIDPQTGKVLICDNDNVAPEGTSTGILGKPRYMAPEIVVGRSMPDTKTDRFSMSVILFILLCMAHPLEGKRSLAPCLTLQLQRKLYGEEPVFIMDRQNRANCPVPGVHDGVLAVWPYLPHYVQDIFCRAFSKEALLDRPNARPNERDWMKILARFRSEIVMCPHCRRDDPNKTVEVFCDEGGNCTCDVCGRSILIPFHLEFVTDRYSLACVNDTRIYRFQVEECNPEVAMEPFARVARHNPEKPGLLYIKNMSKMNWSAVTPSGAAKTVHPDEMIPLKDGIKFIIGRKEIVIKENRR